MSDSSYFKLIGGVWGGFQTFKAVQDSIEVWSSNKLTAVQKTARLSTNLLYMVSQPAESIFSISLSAAETSFNSCVKLSSVATNVLREGVILATNPNRTRWDFLVFAKTTAYQAGDVLELTTKLVPNRFSDSSVQRMKTLSLVLKSTRDVEAIGFLLFCIWREVSRLNFGRLSFISLRMIGRVRFGAQIEPSHLPGDIGPGLKAKISEVLRARTIEAFDKIPPLFMNDKVLVRHLCKLKKKPSPIRFVLVVRGTEQDPHPVFYEKDDYKSYIIANPGQIPPGWPQHIPFHKDAAIIDEDVQLTINRRLERLFQDAKTDYAFIRL